MGKPIWSPDGGRAWLEGNTIYWEDGEITELGPNSIARYMPVLSGEDYSKMSAEERARRQAAAKEKRESYQKVQAERERRTKERAESIQEIHAQVRLLEVFDAGACFEVVSVDLGLALPALHPGEMIKVYFKDEY